MECSKECDSCLNTCGMECPKCGKKGILVPNDTVLSLSNTKKIYMANNYYICVLLHFNYKPLEL